MPVPNNITDLDTTASMNSPQGGESPKGTVDNYLRAGFAFIRQLYNTVDANAATAAAAASAAQATADSKQAALGFTPVQQGTGIGQLTNTVKIGWTGSRLKVTVDTSDMGEIHTSSTMTAANVTAALGYTPYNSTNPSGYQTSAQLEDRANAWGAYHAATRVPIDVGSQGIGSFCLATPVAVANIAAGATGEVYQVTSTSGGNTKTGTALVGTWRNVSAVTAAGGTNWTAVTFQRIA